jgi:hypothetical protein
MKDSARLTRPRFLSSLAYFLHNSHTTACLSLTTTNVRRGQVVHHLLRVGSEAA